MFFPIASQTKTLLSGLTSYLLVLSIEIIIFEMEAYSVPVTEHQGNPKSMSPQPSPFSENLDRCCPSKSTLILPFFPHPAKSISITRRPTHTLSSEFLILSYMANLAPWVFFDVSTSIAVSLIFSSRS